MRTKSKPVLKVKYDDYAIKPFRGHEYDAGLDLKAKEPFLIYPKKCMKIGTGVHIEIPKGYVGMIKTKSSLNSKGLQTEGVIDYGYTGEIQVIMYNHSEYIQPFEKGQKIAQLVVMPCLLYDLEEVDELEETERGEGGFGSTGK